MALGMQSEAEKPRSLSLSVLRPQCQEMLCEAPARRDAATEAQVLPRIKRLFEESLLAAHETRVILVQSCLNWAINQAPIAGNDAILVSKAAISATLIANNAIAETRESPACHHKHPPETISRDIIDELEAAFRPDIGNQVEPLQPGDLIALHLLHQGLVIAGFHGESHPLTSVLESCDLIHHASSLYLNLETLPESPCHSTADISAVLRRVAASPGASLVVDRIVRDMCHTVRDEIGKYDPAHDAIRLPIRDLPYVAKLADICLDLLENDRFAYGAWIASQVMAEIQALFQDKPARLNDRSKPDNEITFNAKISRLAVERNPIWELLSYEDERGSIPRFLARMTTRLADLRLDQNQWTGKQGITLHRYRNAALSWIGREQMASPFWHLFLIRFTRELITTPYQSRRIPPGSNFALADLCQSIEKIEKDYDRPQSQALGKLVQSEATVLVQHPEFMHTSVFQSRHAEEAHKKDGRDQHIPQSESILDGFLMAQIEVGLFPPGARSAGKGQPGENGWAPAFAARTAPHAEGLIRRSNEIPSSESEVPLAITTGRKPPEPKVRTSARQRRKSH